AEYTYDAVDRRIASRYDTDGDDTIDREERYVWERDNVVLDFVDADGDNGGGGSDPMVLARRYLWGPAVDQFLAQETVDDGGAEDVQWAVTDNLGSVRSFVDSDGDITTTYSYSAFGAVTVITGSLSDTRFLYTAQEFDSVTGNYYYNARWYDPATGRFVGVDPIDFAASDINL